MSRQRNQPRKLPMKVPMSPSHLKAYCCLCSEYISYAYNRKNLWHKCVEGKTRICTLVEQVLQLNITRSAHTEFICSSCFSKVKSLNTKIQSIQEEIDTYVEKIGWHGAAMKCKQQVKQGIRERLTTTEPPIKQPGHCEAADSLVGQSIGENNFPPSLPELPPGDGHQQSALMSAPWMTSLLTVLELGSSQPAQSDSPTPGSTPAGTRRSIIEALGRSIPAGSGRSTPKASGRSTPRGSRRSVVADNKRPSPEVLHRSTLEVLRRSTPDALGRSTPEASGRSTPGGLQRSTPGGLQRSTPGDSGRSILADTKRSSSGASGESTPEVLRRSTPEALGRSTPVALGRSSPEVLGRSSPEASERSSPNTSGGSTPEALGRSSPKALRGSTPDISGRSSPPANGRSAVLTEHDYGESTPLSPHTRDGSTHDDHQVLDTATGDIKVSAYWDPDQHSYCRTSESHNDVRIVLETQAGGASKTSSENFVVKDGLAPMGGDYGDCTEEMCGMYDNIELQTELGRAIKIEQSDPQCVEVRDCPSTKKVPCGPQYVVPEVHRVYTVKEDDGSSRYVDVLLPEDNGGNVDVTPFTAARRRRGKRLWKCNLCSLVCKSRHTFIIHERVHTGEKPFLCGTCGRAFAQASYLKTHMRVHTGERPFACRTCAKAYRSTYERTIHERTHRGERPYLCATCGKAFVCNTNLRQHETTHVAVKRHVCPTCGKAFVSHSVLTQHRKIHSGLRPWSCAVCGRAFVTRWHLTRHERSLHPRDPGDAASYITVSTP